VCTGCHGSEEGKVVELACWTRKREGRRREGSFATTVLRSYGPTESRAGVRSRKKDCGKSAVLPSLALKKGNKN
jgi:hypothetical protein